MKEKHPLEWYAEGPRAEESPYARLNEKSLLITNFPKGINVSEAYIKDLCYKYDATAIINSIFIKDAITGSLTTNRNKAAYAIVEFEMPKQIAAVRRGIRKHQEQDRILKVKTLKDESREKHKERTIIVQNLPTTTFGYDDIVNLFGDHGAITSVEMPTIDAMVRSELEAKGIIDPYVRER